MYPMVDPRFPRLEAPTQRRTANLLLQPANAVAGRLCFFTCLSVILLGGGKYPSMQLARGVSQHAMGRGVCLCFWGYTPPGHTHPIGRHHPLLRRPLKWVVRILLQCILVLPIFPKNCIKITSMHSGRMRTGCSMTVCLSLLPGGGVCFPGGSALGCLPQGVWVTQHALRQTPPLLTE